MNKRKIFLMLCLGLVIQSCLTKYVQPKESEDSAILKLKFSHSKFLINSEMETGMYIKEDEKKPLMEGYRKSYGYIVDKPPQLEMGTLKVRVGKPVIISMALTFHWTTTRQEMKTRYVNGESKREWVTVTDHHYRGCTDSVILTPENRKMYLMDYTNPNIDEGCTLVSYEQEIQDNDKFKLKPVGERYLVKK